MRTRFSQAAGIADEAAIQASDQPVANIHGAISYKIDSTMIDLLSIFNDIASVHIWPAHYTLPAAGGVAALITVPVARVDDVQAQSNAPVPAALGPVCVAASATAPSAPRT